MTELSHSFGDRFGQRGRSTMSGAGVDTLTIAFGIRAGTRVEFAQAEARRVLGPGGRCVCLGCSTSAAPMQPSCNLFSFTVIPPLGEMAARTPETCPYRVESIRRCPDRDEFQAPIERAGLEKMHFRDLSFGIAHILEGRKPMTQANSAPPVDNLVQ
jgi:demethylmenaquinone methyltransferase/2-methoxy-6-polyprenyl-1,4-benzoquinol methylase